MSIIDWPLDKWLDNVALGALSSKETLLATFDLALNVIERGVPGDFVECGVYGGAQCAVMARAIMRWPGSLRRVHLFDSFEGLPLPGPEDVEWIDAKHLAGTSLCGRESVEAHMKEWGIPPELLVYHQGWFEDTVHLQINRSFVKQIALLRLDADLYASTRICMEHLYPLLSPGGWLIVDDYGLSGCRKAIEEYTGGNYPPVYWKKQP
jgi:hypothetical protein